MYDSVAGRFVSRDPIGFEGSKWGLYEFLDSGPPNYLDPLGLECAESTYYCVAVFCRQIGWAFGKCVCCHRSLPSDIIKRVMNRDINESCRLSTYYALAKGSVVTYQRSSMVGVLQRKMRAVLGPGIACGCL